MIDKACINHQKRTLLTPFLINLLYIDAKLFPQSPLFASYILRFGEELDKLTKMLPEPNNIILMSYYMSLVYWDGIYHLPAIYVINVAFISHQYITFVI